MGGLSAFYGLLVVALAVPLVAGLYWPRASNAAALASLATSVGVALAALLVTGEPPGPSNLWPSVLGIGAGAIVCVLVSMRAKPGE